MSNITIIGTGNMARTLGARALRGGNTVEIMGRDQAKATQLASRLGNGATTGAWGGVPAGDIVVMALLAAGIVPAAATYGNALAGKVIIDISNPFNATADGLTLDDGTSNAQELAHAVPASANVVKGFNTIFRQVLEDGLPDVFIAGDDAQAKADVTGFIESLGLRPRDVGGLKMAHWLEGAGLLAVGLANNGMRSLDFSLGVSEVSVPVGA